MASARLILRTVVGATMVGHGLQKLNGSFGGPGLEGTEKMMGAIGIEPAKQAALAVALSETIGGGLTATGFLSPLGPAMLIGTMAVAIKKVHLKNGYWVTNGGFEYNLTLVAAALALAIEGPGPISLDGLFGHRRSGPHWGLIALGLGLGGAAAVLNFSEKMASESSGSESGADSSNAHASNDDEAGEKADAG